MNRQAVRTAWAAVRVATLLLALGAGAETDPFTNQYSDAVLPPPDYETFQPPPAGQSFMDPVFGTEIHVLTDQHNVVGWNGERAHFSQDDKYFVVGVKPGGDRKSETWLYDGRTGAFIKALPIAAFDGVRWGYDPKTLVYFSTNQVRGYDVETGADTLLREFDEPVGLCGGDGNDFDDKGEWILLNRERKVGRFFAFNIRTGQTGPSFDCPDPKADIDYATVTPSGQHVVILGGTLSASPERPHSGTGLYDRSGVFIRQLVPFHAHVDFGYVNGTDECIIMKGWGPFYSGWCASRGLHKADVWALSFATGKVTKLLVQAANGYQTAAVGGSNRRYVYAAFEPDGFRHPDRQWARHMGEIVEMPLDGSLRVRRLLHHRCRTGTGAWHTWADQPELWINHAGDRLFFRSNMFLAQGSTAQKYGHDLFLVKIPPRAPTP